MFKFNRLLDNWDLYMDLSDIDMSSMILSNEFVSRTLLSKDICTSCMLTDFGIYMSRQSANGPRSSAAI